MLFIENIFTALAFMSSFIMKSRLAHSFSLVASGFGFSKFVV
jgi:hypothetical protein